MLYRTLTLVLAALAVAVLVSAPALAEKADKGDTQEGTVVKAGDGKLTVTDKEGKKEHTITVGDDVTITCNGKKCKLEDIKGGFTIKVTTKKKGDKVEVTKIEATPTKKEKDK